MRKLRVLHVVPSMLRRGGGPSESVPMTAMAQLKAGMEVGICTFLAGEESEMAQKAESEGVRFYRFPWTFRAVNPMYCSWRMMREFADIARGYDVITTHANWMFPIWWAAYVAHRLCIPYTMMPRGSFGRERLKMSAWKKRLVGVFDRWALRHCAAVWATAESEARDAQTYCPGVKTEVFPIGLEVERFQGSKVPGFQGSRGERTLLFLSRISPIKGLDLLAEAWGRLCRGVGVGGRCRSEWKLLVVGPDDRGYTEEVKKMFAAKCPAGSYEFRDPVYGDEKFKLLASADAFVLPTRNENWGIAVAEAMASGLPVVCTKGAPWACLETAKAGHWVDVSVEGILKGVGDILSMDDDERCAMGERGRRWAAENLDWRKISERMKRSYADYENNRHYRAVP